MPRQNCISYGQRIVISIGGHGPKSEVLEEPCCKNQTRGHIGTAKKEAGEENKEFGTTTLDLDASQWSKGVNKHGKFDGGLIAK